MVRNKVLFVAEDLTLAQVVRLVTLARSLDPQRYELHFAASTFPAFVFEGLTAEYHRVETLPAEQALRDLQRGKRLYEAAVLSRYVKSELELFERIQPDLVIGDFRLSLSTSAEIARIPCAVLINAYWSPYHPRSSFPVPDHPIIGLVGERIAERYFPQAVPRVFAHFAEPLNSVRKQHGLRPVGSLQQMLTHGDFTLYPDVPVLVPSAAPTSHRYLGIVDWQPRRGAADHAFGDRSLPLVYVTLGSSGKRDLLPVVLRALEQMPVRVLVATAGRGVLPEAGPRRRVAEFVRGRDVASHASLVVTNGGSSSGYQALLAGTPVLGIPTNFDQFLASEAIDRAGVGLSLPARRADLPQLRELLQQALHSRELTLRAKTLAQELGRWDSAQLFRQWVEQVIGLRRDAVRS